MGGGGVSGVYVGLDFDTFLHREAGGDTSWVGGHLEGAAVAFGLMGMAFAIGSHHTAADYCVSCRSTDCCSDQGPLVSKEELART